MLKKFIAAKLDFQNFIVTASQSNLKVPSSCSNAMHYGRLSWRSTVMMAVQMKVLR